jgi:hypothetical protein
MKPACVKARVARKSRGQKCPYGFDSRPEHIKSLLEVILRGIFVSYAPVRAGFPLKNGRNDENCAF